MHQKAGAPGMARTLADPRHPHAGHPSARRKRRLILVAAVVILGLGTWLGVRELTSPPTVAVVGDSITALSQQSIATSLAQAGYQPTIQAVPGVKLGQAEPTIRRLAQQDPDDWIIELGTATPDWHALWPQPFLAEWQLVRLSRCVIYVSVSPHAGPVADQINTALAALARAHANVHVLDWGQLEYINPGWTIWDTIHPTSAGQAELAALEVQALRRGC